MDKKEPSAMPNEYITEDLINGYKLLQREPYCKLGMDAVMLAAFLSPAKTEKVCDLGSGGGAVTVLIAARYHNAAIDGVEIQPKASELLEKNILFNEMSDRVRSIRADLGNLDGVLYPEAYTAVVCNPPYFPTGRGKSGNIAEKAIERTEIATDLNDICKAAGRLLKHGGEFAMVCRADRLCDIVLFMRKAQIEPKRLKYIQNTATSAPKLLLISGRKNSAPGLKTEAPLLIRAFDGKFSDEYLKVYEGGVL